MWQSKDYGKNIKQWKRKLIDKCNVTMIKRKNRIA